MNLINFYYKWYGKRRGKEATTAASAEIERKSAFYAPQLIIICRIAIVPLLAVVGVFGERTESVEAWGAGLWLHVDYPRLMRYKTDDSLVITVENASDQPMGGVVVRVSEDYLSQFSNVVFSPELRQITTHEEGEETNSSNQDEGSVV